VVRFQFVTRWWSRPRRQRGIFRFPPLHGHASTLTRQPTPAHRSSAWQRWNSWSGNLVATAVARPSTLTPRS